MFYNGFTHYLSTSVHMFGHFLLVFASGYLGTSRFFVCLVQANTAPPPARRLPPFPAVRSGRGAADFAQRGGGIRHRCRGGAVGMPLRVLAKHSPRGEKENDGYIGFPEGVWELDYTPL